MDHTTKEQRNMVHLWQYSGNAEIATCSKALDATCMSFHTCSEEISQVLVKSGLFKGALLPAPDT